MSRVSRRSVIRGPVATLLGGAALGQLLVLLASPALTRLYSPADFGALAVTTSIATGLGSVATLSWDRAVVLTRGDAMTRAVVCLSIVSVVLVTTTTAGSMLVLRAVIADVFAAPSLIDAWWVVPVTVGVIGAQRVVTASAVRAHAFGLLSRRSLFQGLGQAAAGVALAPFGTAGLLVSTAVGRALGSLTSLRTRSATRRARLSRRAIVVSAHRYRRFPLVTTWSTLLNAVGLQAPQLLLTVTLGATEAGFVALAVRVLASPVGMAAEAMGQAFDSSASRAIREGAGGVTRHVRRAVLTSSAIALPALIVVVIGGPALFSMVFGDDWSQAGRIARVMVVMVAAQFVAVPISRTLAMLEKQQGQLAWDFSRLVVTNGAIVVCGLLHADLVPTLTIWSLSATSAYAALVIVTLRAASEFDRSTPSVATRPPTSTVVTSAAPPPPPEPARQRSS